MLPDFTEVKKEIQKSFNIYLAHRQRESGFLSGIKREHHFEGNSFKYNESQDNIGQDATGYKTVSSEMSVSTEDIIEKGIDAFANQLEEMITKLTNQTEQLVLDKLYEITDRTGNVVDAKNTEFSIEHLIQAMECMEVSFDANGNQNPISVVLHPDMAEKVKHKIIEWSKDPEINARIEKVRDKKREEWNAKQNNRKLVD